MIVLFCPPFKASDGRAFAGNKQQKKMNMTMPVFTDSLGKMQFVVTTKKVTSPPPSKACTAAHLNTYAEQIPIFQHGQTLQAPSLHYCRCEIAAAAICMQ